MKRIKLDKEKRESTRQELDFLLDSLDFEPVNFNEFVGRIRYLMCLS